ncbi:MAG: penicillin-binding transpeptidase domain-containing protein [Fervidobacterium sp.]
MIKLENARLRRYTPFILFLCMFFYLIYGLVKVQIIEQQKYKSFLIDLLGKSEYNKGLRGTIYSSDGVKIAWSEVKPILAIEKYTENDEIKLKRYLPIDQIVRLKNTGSVELDWEQAFLLKSIGYKIETIEKRHSYGFLYHIVGSVNIDKEGVSGLEFTYNDVLKGKIGVSYTLRTPSGKYQQGILENQADSGLNLQTTINFSLQKFIYETLKQIGKPSVAIVSKPKTGEILAMVSFPAPENDMNELDSITWEKLTNDQLKPLLNRAISNVYPPGSTFKVITAIAQLLYSSPKTVACTGVYKYMDSKGRVTGIYKDWLPSGHGIVDLKKALRVSCNVYFYNAALDVGVDGIVNVAKAFKIGQITGIQIPGEVSGTLPTPDWKYENFKEKWYPGDTILYGIGQGFINVTPLQMLSVYNTIANKGIIVKPKLILNEETKEEKIGLSIPDEYWDTIITGLEEVTTIQGPASSAGTAASSFVGFPVKVAGKTGTAQTHDGEPHAWFVGFAPSREPMYSILVLIEHGESGGHNAAPVARQILDFMYQNGFFDNK